MTNASSDMLLLSWFIQWITQKKTSSLCLSATVQWIWSFIDTYCLSPFFRAHFFCLGKWLLCNSWRDYLVLLLYQWMECQKVAFPINYNFWENMTFCISLNSPLIFVKKDLLDRYKNSEDLSLLWLPMKEKNCCITLGIHMLHYFCPWQYVEYLSSKGRIPV